MVPADTLRGTMIRIFGIAASITLVMTGLTQAICYYVWGNMAGGYDPMIVIVGTALPASSCFPLVTFFLVQRKKLADALADLKQTHELLSRRAQCDPMTGLLHRQAFYEKLNAQAKTADRVFLMIDVDGFKAVNDTFGHEAGDEALLAIAGALGSALGEDCLLARFGGEEFCLSAPVDLAGGRRLGESIRRKVAALDFQPAGRPRYPLTVSVGVACAWTSGSASQAIRDADAALYEAKRTGRNRVVAARSEESVPQPSRRAPLVA